MNIEFRACGIRSGREQVCGRAELTCNAERDWTLPFQLDGKRLAPLCVRIPFVESRMQTRPGIDALRFRVLDHCVIAVSCACGCSMDF